MVEHSRTHFRSASASPGLGQLEDNFRLGDQLPADPFHMGVPARNSFSNGAGLTRNIRTADMSFENFHTFGDLVPRYLRARKSIFIDRLNWHVSEANGMEFDQYDNPFCRWVVLLEFGEILGGVRLLPTTARYGIYSYMLRDAHLGLLDDFPTDVLFIDPPTHSRAWEASRFFINDNIPGARRLLIQGLLFAEMNRVAKENGAQFILGIVPAIWSRWARRLHVTATPIGVPFTIDQTRNQSVLFEVDSLGPQAATALVSLQEGYN